MGFKLTEGIQVGCKVNIAGHLIFRPSESDLFERLGSNRFCVHARGQGGLESRHNSIVTTEKIYKSGIGH